MLGSWSSSKSPHSWEFHGHPRHASARPRPGTRIPDRRRFSARSARRELKTAFEFGLIDHLLERHPASLEMEYVTACAARDGGRSGEFFRVFPPPHLSRRERRRGIARADVLFGLTPLPGSDFEVRNAPPHAAV